LVSLQQGNEIFLKAREEPLLVTTSPHREPLVHIPFNSEATIRRRDILTSRQLEKKIDKSVKMYNSLDLSQRIMDTMDADNLFEQQQPVIGKRKSEATSEFAMHLMGLKESLPELEQVPLKEITDLQQDLFRILSGMTSIIQRRC